MGHDGARLTAQMELLEMGNAVSGPSIYSALLSGLLVGGAGAFLLMRRRMRSVAQLATQQLEGMAVVSHEYSNAVAVLLAAGENLRDGLVASEGALRDQGRVITVQASRMKSLADHVLLSACPLNQAQDCAVKKTSADEVIDDALFCVANLLDEKQFVVERKIRPGLPRFEGELSALSRCLQNLVINAVKYSGKSRWVRIAAELCARPDADASEIQISVHDRGVGIAEKDIEHVFEPFYRCRNGAMVSNSGSGLGLCIARRDAESSGGRLSVVSEEGSGSVFTLHLPLHNGRSARCISEEKFGREVING